MKNRNLKGSDKQFDLKKYKELNEGLVMENGSKNTVQSIGKACMVLGLPVLAVSQLNAQCQGSLGMGILVDDTGGPALVDVDGDGNNDLSFLEQPNGNLKVKALGSISIVRTNGPYASHSANNFNANAAIPGGLPGATSTLFLDYPGGGQWAVGGVGSSATGFMGLKDGTDYGFLELTVTLLAGGGNGSQYSLDIPEAGMSNPGTGAVNAGACESLPSELVSFKVKVEGEKADLHWETFSEYNNAGFEIQRSEDGENFRPLTFVEGQGNTQVKTEYRYEDKALLAGQVYYYRLKQVDFDGKFEFSNILQAKTESQATIAGEFSPNPSTAGQVSIRFEAKESTEWTATVFGPSGQLLRTAKLFVEEGRSRQQLDLAGLPSGLYFVKLENGAEHLYRKVSIE